MGQFHDTFICQGLTIGPTTWFPIAVMKVNRTPVKFCRRHLIRLLTQAITVLWTSTGIHSLLLSPYSVAEMAMRLCEQQYSQLTCPVSITAHFGLNSKILLC